MGFGRRDPTNRLRWALEETDRVGERLDEALGDVWDAPFLALGVIPNATRRISTEIPIYTAQDRCAVFHASRIFTSAVGVFALLRRGMVLESVVLLRTMVETVAQAIALMRRADMAEAWMNGKQFKPGKIRDALAGSPDFKPLYDLLSGLAHVNPQARWLHSVATPDGRGYAIGFGGAYQPKAGAHQVAVLTELALVYLRAFHAHYAGRLDLAHWPVVFFVSETAVEYVRQRVDAMPDDRQALAAHALERGPEPPMPPLDIDRADLDRMLEALREGPADDSREVAEGDGDGIDR